MANAIEESDVQPAGPQGEDLGANGTSESSGNRRKTTSPRPSPTSAEARRGRSRTRHIPPPASNNERDRRGYHTIMSSFGKAFHVEKRWKLLRELGSGAYGFVISASDEISGEPVAIKLVTRAFEKVQLAKRALREITLLRHFCHENITGLIDVDCSPSLDEIYIFLEPMEADLHQIIKSGQTLTNEHVQYFVYQILRGLKYIHSASVVHRDLKPGNLLVNADCDLKICDFGLSRGFDSAPDHPTIMTEYVATRWYRAPEIMLAFKGYNTAIDIWSVGCILAELLLGKPLFKGKDYVDQLNKILEILGTPEDKVIRKIGSDKAQAYIRSLPRKRTVPFTKVVPMADPQALDMLKHLVAFDPTSRYNCTEALAHPWLSSYHDEADEPECEHGFEKWRALEKLETIDDYRIALKAEIESYRREVRSAPSILDTDTRSPSKGVDEVSAGSEEQESGGDQLGPMPGTREVSPESIIKSHSRNHSRRTSEVVLSPTDHTTAPVTGETDPVVAYARRSSIFQPSRTNSTYSAHRVSSTEASETPTEKQGQGSTIAFPSGNNPEYVVPARARTASMAGHGAWPSTEGGRRRLLRTLSTVSVYETGEGLEGTVPIVKLIGEQNRTGEDPLKSAVPKELGGLGSSGSSEQVSKASGSGEGQTGAEGVPEKKRRFIID